MPAARLESFVERVLAEGKRLYRDLPWRGVDDPYAVLVSEIMLQQTQVSRVLKYWERFLGSFPTVDALAAASVNDVLEHWQGLGYNRRALALKKAAEHCSRENGGRLYRSYDELLSLPGIGPATAAGVVAFAYQEPALYLETNVRSVLIREFFTPEVGENGDAPNGEESEAARSSVKVSDKELIPLVAACAFDPRAASDPRAWNYALLDVGADLKSRGMNPSRRSSAYKRQSKFEGSRRQKRALVVRAVVGAGETISAEAVYAELNVQEQRAGRAPVDREVFDSIVADLESEGFFLREGDCLRAL